MSSFSHNSDLLIVEWDHPGIGVRSFVRFGRRTGILQDHGIEGDVRILCSGFEHAVTLGWTFWSHVSAHFPFFTYLTRVTDICTRQFLGQLFAGWFADRYGRTKTIYLMILNVYIGVTLEVVSRNRNDYTGS